MIITLLAATSVAAAAPQSVAAMKWDRRVLIVSAPDANNAALGEQLRLVAAWQKEGAERDLTVVTVVGSTVMGASDDAVALRRRYKLSADRFSVILIGKDGGEKLRNIRPIAPALLKATIDAMPMRQAGGR